MRATSPPPACARYDAIHLATALTLVEDLTSFVTYDARLAAAAAAAGIAVAVPAPDA